VYYHLEGWGPIDTVYFLTVTATTIGYGDLCPQTSVGRAFTTVYMVVGMQVPSLDLA
jgi:voltage-gated potassium channel